MASFGDFYNKNKKKLSKDEMARKAAKQGSSAPSWVLPQPELMRARGKKEK